MALDKKRIIVYFQPMSIFNYFSYSLLAAVIIQILCQLSKLFYYSLKDRSFKISYFFSAGGMPSSHTAFVTALTTSIALRNGLNSELFAIAFVFSGVIIYDAYRLRGTVQIHSRILQELKKMVPGMENREIPQMVGHTMPEIIAGLILGVIFAAGVYFVMGR